MDSRLLEFIVGKFQSYRQFLYEIAESEDISVRNLEILLEIDDEYIMTAVALNSNTSLNMLLKMLDRFQYIDVCDETIIHILSNKNISIDILRKYSTFEDSVYIKEFATITYIKRCLSSQSAFDFDMDDSFVEIVRNSSFLTDDERESLLKFMAHQEVFKGDRNL